MLQMNSSCLASVSLGVRFRQQLPSPLGMLGQPASPVLLTPRVCHGQCEYGLAGSASLDSPPSSRVTVVGPKSRKGPDQLSLELFQLASPIDDDFFSNC
jgi:hypothetical protein